MKVLFIQLTICVGAGLGLTSCGWFGSSPDPEMITFDVPMVDVGRENGDGVDENREKIPNMYEPIKVEEVKKPLIAKAVQGRPGYVINPHNGNMVNVLGIPSGTLVKDPNDAAGNVFYVP